MAGRERGRDEKGRTYADEQKKVQRKGREGKEVEEEWKEKEKEG